MTTVNKNLKVWAFAAVLAMSAGVSAQQQAATNGAAPQTQTIDRYVVGQAKPPDVPGSQMLNLTLEDAMQRALDKNIDLQVARINPLIQDYNLVTARAAFTPTLSASFNQNRAASTSTNVLDGVSSLTNLVNQSQTYQTNLSQTLPWYGSTLGLSFSSSRGTTNSINTTRNPNYAGSFRAQGSLPLLANFKIDNQRNQLRTQVVQRQISDLTLLSAVENTKSSVRAAYWNLKAAIEAIEIQKRAVDLAKRSLADSQTKVEIGTLAPIDTVNFETQVAAAEQGLLAAQIAWTTQELTFKRLIVSGPDDELYKMTINPVDAPGFTVENVDIPTAVRNAIASRADIDSARKSIQVSQMNLEVTKNQTMPTLNLTGSYQVAGVGGPEFDRNHNPIADGGYFDALRGIGSLNTPTWTAAVQFNYPIGMMAQRASLARAELALQQSQTNLKATELSISTEVTQAGLNVQNTYLQYLAAKKTREAREKNAEATQTRFDVGMSTNFEVVQAQQDLTSSRLNELQSILRYVNAVAEFDRVQKVGAR
jgi:outer membrane protein TolC